MSKIELSGIKQVFPKEDTMQSDKIYIMGSKGPIEVAEAKEIKCLFCDSNHVEPLIPVLFRGEAKHICRQHDPWHGEEVYQDGIYDIVCCDNPSDPSDISYIVNCYTGAKSSCYPKELYNGPIRNKDLGDLCCNVHTWRYSRKNTKKQRVMMQEYLLERVRQITFVQGSQRPRIVSLEGEVERLRLVTKINQRKLSSVNGRLNAVSTQDGELIDAISQDIEQNRIMIFICFALGFLSLVNLVRSSE